MTKSSPESVGMDAGRLERVGPVMQAYVDRGIYAGVSTIIARRGVVVHEGQYGFRDREAGLPTTNRSAWSIRRLQSPKADVTVWQQCTAGRTLSLLARHSRSRLGGGKAASMSEST